MSLRILVVEDFKSTRMQETRILQDLGYSDIFEAEDGEAAISILAEHNDIGLIISDWNMPKMGGLELLEYVRSDENLKSIPFVMATAQGETSAQNQAKQAGANGYVIKPFTAADLKSALDKIFENSPSDIGDKAKRPPQKAHLKAAHIQITDHLAPGVLNRLISTGELSPRHFTLETVCMPSWNPIRESLEKGIVDAAFVLAPIAMDLFHAGVPIKLVLFAHKNGSICIRNIRGRDDESLHGYLKSKVFFIPHVLSIHHMLADMFLKEIGLKLGPVGKEGVDVFYEVVPPIKMPEYLCANTGTCGFAVAEPMGTKAIMDGSADLLFRSGELWENHPCCVLVVRNEYIDKHTDAVYEFVEMLARSGRFIADNPDSSAEIAAEFLDPEKSLGMTPDLLAKVLREPAGIRTDDMFPIVGDLDKIQRYMFEKMGIGSLIDPEKFVDDRFAANAADILQMARRASMMREPAGIVANIVNRRFTGFEESELTAKLKGGVAKEDRESGEIMEITRKKTSAGFRISSKMDMVDGVVRQARKFLADLGFTIFSEFKLVLRELLINAIEHGNKKDPDKLVICDIVQVRDALFKISVTDQGSGFDFHGVPKSIPEGGEENHRGRGYPIIHASAERVAYDEKNNTITAHVRIRQETVFDVGDENGWKIVRPTGDITASVANKLQELVNGLISNGHKKLTFDLQSVEDMDSVGLSVFIVLNKMRLEDDPDIEIQIAGAGDDVANLFRMTRLNKAFHIQR